MEEKQESNLDRKKPITRMKEAAKYFIDGFNCSQAVVATYCEQLGLDKKTALKLACPFGSGMARTAKTCGAVSGAYMLIGLKYGQYLAEDTEAKEKCYRLAKEFTDRFHEVHGSINCYDLLKADLGTLEGMQYVKENDLWNTLCPIFVSDAAHIIEEILDLL